ncbi:MAG: inner-rane translocator, partial [Thermoleophilia bacterium]|nr:inner-rane translocator [Thermoleophilia bacterium]
MGAAAAPASHVPALDRAPVTAPARPADLRAAAARFGPWLLVAGALFFPMIDASLGLEMMNPMLRILTSVMLALGLNIVVGFAGLLDLGYVAFWAIGAYCVGWLASSQFSTIKVHVMSGMDHGIPGIHVSIWLIFPIAAVVTALFGVLLGAPTLRLRGDYLAIVTLGFGEIIPSVFRNGDDILGHNVTNGTAGISGLDAPSMGGAAVDNSMGLGWGTWGPLNLSPWYYLALLLCGICFYVARTMQWSKLGRAWMAIREDETAASAMGIHCVNAKLWAYGIGASLGSLAGVYHGARIGSIFPSSFMFYISISVLCMVIVGGMG